MTKKLLLLFVLCGMAFAASYSSPHNLGVHVDTAEALRIGDQPSPPSDEPGFECVICFLGETCMPVYHGLAPYCYFTERGDGEYDCHTWGICFPPSGGIGGIK